MENESLSASTPLRPIVVVVVVVVVVEAPKCCIVFNFGGPEAPENDTTRGGGMMFAMLGSMWRRTTAVLSSTFEVRSAQMLYCHQLGGARGVRKCYREKQQQDFRLFRGQYGGRVLERGQYEGRILEKGQQDRGIDEGVSEIEGSMVD